MSNPYANYSAQQFASSPANGTMFSLFSDSGAGVGVLLQWITNPAALILFVIAGAIIFFAIGLAIAKFIKNVG